MVVRLLTRDEKPSQGFVRRPRPLWEEFAVKMTWFSEMELQPNGVPGMVYCFVPKTENWQYEHGETIRSRYCNTYRGRIRKNLDLIWAEA